MMTQHITQVYWIQIKRTNKLLTKKNLYNVLMHPVSDQTWWGSLEDKTKFLIYCSKSEQHSSILAAILLRAAIIMVKGFHFRL